MGEFLHGVEIKEVDSGPRPISGVDASVIGIVGTATAGSAEANKPCLIAGSRKEAVELFGEADPSAGTVPFGNTLPYALAGLLDQTGATIVVIKVAVGSGPAANFTALDNKAKETARKANVAKDDKTKTDVEKEKAANLAKEAAENLAEAKDKAIPTVLRNIEKVKTGVGLLVGAESVVHKTPRILIAPGFSHIDDTIRSALGETAERLRGIAIVDGPNAHGQEAITTAKTAAKDVDNPRIYMVDPWVTVACGENEKGANKLRAEPPSSRIAGVIAKSDSQRGFWFSPSNRPIVGISGTSRSVDFSLGDKLASANQLNAGNVATIIHQNGYRLWGNRSCSTDAKWAFISVRRTADLINDALLSAHLWAVDRNINKTYVEDVTEGVNAYLRHLKSTGAIINGKCWADPEENTRDMITQGKVTFDFDFTPPYPAEHITFRSSMVNDYLEEIFA